MSNGTSRAKQFLPFDALAGFREALVEKEIEYEARKELAEDSLEELENQLNRLKRGCRAKVRYYKNKRYMEVWGMVTNIDYAQKKIQIDGDNINVCDIARIEVE